VRFHQAISFLSLSDSVELAKAADLQGYAGLYLSDHLFNPRELQSRYTYSKAPDGSPFWDKETAWPDPMVLIGGLATVTSQLLFTTGVYVAPVRDLITVAKSVGTAAALSNNRVRLGVGVGWCAEEFAATGQSFTNRGKRLNDMIPALRALWAGGWVEYHGTHYDVPECQMNPSPSRPVPIYGGGDSDVAIRRAVTLCDGWLTTGAASPEKAWEQLDRIKKELRAVGRENDPFDIYLALAAPPDVDLYRRFEEAGVTDLMCAPWMTSPATPDMSDQQRLGFWIDASARFADDVVQKMA
jgi:probable F420-dependent oxidoreductase